MSINQKITFQASPETLYGLLTDAARFSVATGAPAELSATEGGSFSLFGGFIQGRQIELVPGERIVQAWRGADWEPGVFSMVRFTLAERNGGTELTVDHDAYPEGPSPMYPTWHEHLDSNWPVFYFEPMAKYLANKVAA